MLTYLNNIFRFFIGRTTLVVLLSICSCGPSEEKLMHSPSIKKSGITFENNLSETDGLNIQTYLYFYNGGGIAIGDINNDDLPDIFFSGNQVKNRLYLNKGNLEFEDVSERAGISGNSSWNTGAVMADVNGDGLLDIYVVAVVGLHGFRGHNELYINNGNLNFTESASEYGLDFQNFGTSAAFLDYDRDGDLDLYLLNHAVHTQQSLDYVDVRLERKKKTGDKLLRNDEGYFTDVSEEANIYGGPNGYGLGVAVSDFNNDGWPDLYISNDFQEDDYYYLNTKNGGFTELAREAFGQLSRFSMGNDVADINADGWPDLLTLDMLPADEKVLKASESDDNVQTELLRTREYGYHHQFSRNMLQVNLNGTAFSETALLSGIAATDWSWSALFADFDQDGLQDLFISNGIVKRPNDLDYINYFSSSYFFENSKDANTINRKGLYLMPSGAVPNKIFKGRENLLFEDKSDHWIKGEASVSTATAMGDLDNDGDIDVITNNINDSPTLYINQTNDKATYLKIKFKYVKKNIFGIGTKVISYHNGIEQHKELYTTRGFQASSEPMLHFGYDKVETVDSLLVLWPNGTSQTLENIPVDQTLVISPKDTVRFDYTSLSPNKSRLFKKVSGNLGIDLKPRTRFFSEFNLHRLLPYSVSSNGSVINVGDLNGDSKSEVVFQDFQKTYVHKDSSFLKQDMVGLGLSPKKLKVLKIADFNQDGKNDLLYVVEKGSGKNEGHLALAGATDFQDSILPDYFENGPVLVPFDYDQDGDIDVFVGNRSIANNFGKLPDSYLLEYDQGQLKPKRTFTGLGMVRDAIWNDFDGDGRKDLIVVGEWMTPKFFKNTNGQLAEIKVLDEKANGLWQGIQPFDIDGDGDTDYLLGNWGLNSKFKASKAFPLKMYYSDFDGNGTTETVIATEIDGDYYPLENFQELSKQLVYLRKKFTTFKDFAGKTIEEIFDAPKLKNSKVLTAHNLSSGYLENVDGNFKFRAFNNKMQSAPITEFLKYDFDADGTKEVLAAGNFLGLKPFHGRLGAFPGAIISKNDGVMLGNEIGLDLLNKEVRNANIIHFNNQPYLLISYKDGYIDTYSFPN